MKNQIQINLPDVFITITKLDREYEFKWTDGVANEWVEHYPLLSLAFVRLGALVSCAEHDWNKGFATDNNDFVLNASLFLEKELVG